MAPRPPMDDPTLDRRTFMQGAAGSAAALAATLGLPAAAPADGPDDDDDGQDHAQAQVPPKPIPGGVPLPSGLIHVFSPGDPSITLPFSHLPLFGFDTEPGTITDFDGFEAMAFHAGSATDRDGTHYDLETDMRVFRGRYVDGTGTRRFGTFAFIWVDLFEPGSGSQVHDFNGGILPSGLFWTLPVDDDALKVSRNRRRAVLEVRDIPVLDAFQFGGPNQTPATVSYRIEWRATGDPTPRGKGTTVPADDPGAFVGELAVARSTASFSGSEFGFAFRSDEATTDRGYAQLGTVRNGSFL